MMSQPFIAECVLMLACLTSPVCRPLVFVAGDTGYGQNLRQNKTEKIAVNPEYSVIYKEIWKMTDDTSFGHVCQY